MINAVGVNKSRLAPAPPLFRRHGLASGQRTGRRARVIRRLIRDGESLEVSHPRFAAVTGSDAFQPRAIVKRLRGCEIFPDIRTAGDLSVHLLDELLADET